MKKLFSKYLHSICNPEEANTVIDYLKDKANDPEIISYMEPYWKNQLSYNDEKPKTNPSLFKRIIREINYADNLLLNKKLKLYKTALRFAAVLVSAFIIGGLTIYYSGKKQSNTYAINEVIVPLGERAEVILPDQTHVWLNAGTHLKYPSCFEENKRDVELMGEAFFDVKHNADRPFHINTTNLTVEVLGTRFNVEAINGHEEINVTLVEGKVNLQTKKGKFLIELKPNQNATYNLKEKTLDISPVNVDFYTSWTKGMLLFKDEKLFEIAKKLESWYNVTIEFDEEVVKEIKFSGTILKNKPIDQILDILKFTSNIDYNIIIRNEKPNIIHLKKKPM